jgi:cation transport ATPase
MMLLIGMALTVAFVASAATTAGFFDLDLWWELVLLVTVMLLGHWLEMRAVGQASGALDALTALLPDTVERVTDDGIETISLDELREGYVVLVRSGGCPPTARSWKAQRNWTSRCSLASPSRYQKARGPRWSSGRWRPTPPSG